VTGPFTIAIDGPAAAGKGTIAKAVAAQFGFGYLDTGLLYRATARRVLAGQAPIDAAKTLNVDDLGRSDLRTAEVAEAASQVAALPDVRAALVDFQRRFAARDGGAVLDGRDIGTVICPDADVKLFVTASTEIRAARRYGDLIAAGGQTTMAKVLADVKIRDYRDENRSNAPLKPAPDAVLLDTSELSIDAAVAEAVAHITKRIGQSRD